MKDNTQHHQIHCEQIRALYQQAPFLLVAIIVFMTLFMVLFWDRVTHELLYTWLFLNVALTLARIYLVKSFHKRQPDNETISQWGVVFALSSGFSGMLWGSTAFFMIDTANIETVLVVAVTLTGMVAGSLVPLSSFKPAYFAFSISTLSPLIIVMLLHSDRVFMLIGYMVIFYLLVILGYSFVVNRNMHESFRLRFENMDLLEDLKIQRNISEKANANKSRFLAATSHDLRQPLHALDLFLGALNKLLTTDEQIDLIKKSRNSSRSLRELLNALMDVSKLDSGGVVANIEEISLNNVISKIEEEFRVLAEDKDLSFRVHKRDLWVVSDVVLLNRMIRNLVSNAIKYNNSGKIVIGVRKRGMRAIIEVYDTGSGIRDSEYENIFTEFYQLDNPERDRAKGLGLGLSIVKRLSKLLSHPVDVRSIPGKGSCFTVSIPLSEFMNVRARAESGEVKIDISGLFIVVIEDEVMVRDAMRVLLRSRGCEVLICDSEISALQQLKSDDYPQPDLIISDYRLRVNKTGIEAVSAIRKMYDADIPSIVITGDTASDIKNRVQKAGCGLIYKPIQSELLEQAISEMARKKPHKNVAILTNANA